MYTSVGGVGKTSCSCAIAYDLSLTAPADKPIFLISLDPAHNLSDVFQQKIGHEPTPVEGIPGLVAAVRCLVLSMMDGTYVPWGGVVRATGRCGMMHTS